MADRNNDVITVQALRNATEAVTFPALTSILLVVGMMTLSGRASALKTTGHDVNVAGSQ